MGREAIAVSTANALVGKRRAAHSALLARDLGENGVPTGAYVGSADMHGHKPGFLQAKVHGTNIYVADAGTLHGGGDAEASNAIAQVAYHALLIPTDHLPGADKAFVQLAAAKELVVVLRHDLAGLNQIAVGAGQ